MPFLFVFIFFKLMLLKKKRPDENMFVRICPWSPFRLPDRVDGAAGRHGDGAHHVRGTGTADPPLPGKDPTHCKS